MITVLYQRAGWDFWHVYECATEKMVERMRQALMAEGYIVK